MFESKEQEETEIRAATAIFSTAYMFLGSYTNYEDLLNKCQEHRLISNSMIVNIESDAGENVNDQHRNLLMKLTQRGPHAYDILLKICKELGYDDAYQILNPNPYRGTDIDLRQKREEMRIPESRVFTDSKPLQDVVDVELTEYLEDVPKNVNVQTSTKLIIKNDKATIEAYNMMSKHRGILFLVNIVNFPDAKKRREGAAVDKDRLIDLFRQMNFKIMYYEDLEKEQFDRLVEKFAKSQYLRRPECLVFALLTHGFTTFNTAYAEFSDGGIFKIEEIIEYFSNTYCDYMIGKPKLFLFPFSRGPKYDVEYLLTETRLQVQQVQTDGPYTSVGHVKRFPTFSDILICYASVPGYKTHLDEKLGSWYIQKFCEVLAQYAHCASIEEMLKLINQEVGQMQTTDNSIETPSFESWAFNKLLYFNPGISV